MLPIGLGLIAIGSFLLAFEDWWLSLAVVATCLLLYLQFFRPRLVLEAVAILTLSFYSFVYTTPILEVRGASIYPCDFFFLSTSIFVAWNWLTTASWRNVAIRHWPYFLLYCFVGAIGILRGIANFGHPALGESRLYVLPIFFYFALVQSTTHPTQLIPIARRLLFACSITIVANAAIYVIEGKFDEAEGRFRFLNAPEALATGFITIFFGLRALNERLPRTRFRHLAVFVVLVFLLLVAQVRSAWVAVALTLLVFGGKQLGLKNLARLACTLGCCFVLYYLLVPDDLQEQLAQGVAKSLAFVYGHSRDDTGAWRVLGWEQELEVFYRSPLLGQGLGGYSEWYDGRTWQRVAVHNGFIMILSKFGIAGLVVLLLDLALWYRSTRKAVVTTSEPFHRASIRYCQACVLAHLVFVLFYDITPFFWLILGAGTVLAREALASGRNGMHLVVRQP